MFHSTLNFFQKITLENNAIAIEEARLSWVPHSILDIPNEDIMSNKFIRSNKSIRKYHALAKDAAVDFMPQIKGFNKSPLYTLDREDHEKTLKSIETIQVSIHTHIMFLQEYFEYEQITLVEQAKREPDESKKLAKLAFADEAKAIRQELVKLGSFIDCDDTYIGRTKRGSVDTEESFEALLHNLRVFAMNELAGRLFFRLNMNLGEEHRSMIPIGTSVDLTSFVITKRFKKLIHCYFFQLIVQWCTNESIVPAPSSSSKKPTTTTDAMYTSRPSSSRDAIVTFAPSLGDIVVGALFSNKKK